jgi:hypothetical protein
MAVQYIGIEKGAQSTTVTTDTSTTGKTVELAVDLADGATRAQVHLALKAIEQFILDTRTTPFAQ